MKKFVLAVLCTAVLSACSESSTAPGDLPARAAANGVVMSATGGGHYLLVGALDVKFAFSANQDADGKAAGQFHIAFEDGALNYKIHGEVTCMAVDPVNHRAWIGGVIKAIDTNDPDLMQERHQVGRDVWFRVLDGGEGKDAVDRTTFYGFESPAIRTSADYCQLQIWPAGNARTWPVTQGNISVRP